MGRLGQIAGLLLLAVGIGLAAWGTPYYMLDWGSTFVMAGIALASAGLSCVLLGTVLVNLADLRSDIMAIRAVAALDGHEESLASHEDAEPELTLTAHREANLRGVEPIQTKPDAAGSGTAGSGTLGSGTPASGTAGAIAGVAVAGAAAGGLAMAAKSILTSVNTNGVETAADNDAAAGAEAAVASDEPAAAASQLTAGDRTALDDLLAKLTLPLSAEQADSASEEDAAAEPDNAETQPASTHADELFERIDKAAGSLHAEATGDQDSDPDAEVPDTQVPDTHVPDTHVPGAEVSMEQRIDEEFADLRAELAKLPDEPRSATEVSASDADQPSTAIASFENLQPLPAQDDAQSSNENDAADDRQPEDAGQPEEGAFSSAARDHEAPDDEKVEPSPAANAAQQPTASTEDVVAAYNVGDTAYAMFADGRIRVSAPEGQFMLGSMDELKSFMAARRSEA